ncbi:MAG: alpha/beta fold hydrolase, partial [Bacteroidota bacterium]
YEEAPSAFLLPSPLSFDSSVAGLYWTLTSGGALVLPPSGAEREVQRLATLISEHGVTHTLCVPLLYEHLLRHAPPEALVSLRAVIVAGEACPAALATLHADRQPATVLFNEYGPTESTVWATVYRVEAPAPPRIPIGHPIPGADAYVLDAAQRLVPVGVPGELYLGGPGLASGYLGRPDLTRTRFLPHPFRPEARLYRTGDRVRRLEDGTLDFLGRLDEQVKVRGHRIELGEVEAALRLHPHVASCAVAAPTVGERAVLAAYVVPAAETVPRETLDAHLRAHLPTYMVPDHLVFLEALPVNANGKVDRAALPRPVAPEQEDAFEPPLTPTELQMVALWEEVLEVRPISTTDSFFDLGGHSLLAALLFARIEETFERVIPLASLFAHPTPKALAALMQEPGGGRRQSPVCIQPGTDPDRRPLFLLPGAGGSVTKFYKLARHLGLEYPVYGLEVRGIDGREDAHTDIPSMAAYHLEELLATQPEGPYLLGGFSSGGLVAYEMACQLHEAGHEVADVILFDTYNPVYEHARKRGATRDKLSGLRYLRRRASGVRHSVQRDHQQRQRVRQAQHHLQQGTPVPEPLRTQWLQGQHEAALRTYVPRPYAGDVCFFSACGADKGPMNHRFEDGWRDLAGGTFTVYSVDGTHSLIREPFVGNVARLLREHLAQRMQTAGF